MLTRVYFVLNDMNNHNLNIPTIYDENDKIISSSFTITVPYFFLKHVALDATVSAISK